MKKILFLSFIVLSLIGMSQPRFESFAIQKQDDNGNVTEKEVSIRKLDIPNIYELRDKESVFKSIDLDLYKKDIFLSKLLPRQETQYIPTSDNVNPFMNLDIKDIFVRDLDSNDLSINGIGINGLEISNFYLDYIDIVTNRLNIHEVEVIVNKSVYDYLDALKEETKFSDEYIKNSKVEYLKDLQNLDLYSRYEWIRILKENKKCNIKYIPNKKKFKILAEVRLEECYDIELYKRNLEKAISFGYNGILFRFDTNEDKEKYKEIINITKDNGFDVFLTYVGLDNQNPKWNPFCNMYKLEFFLQDFCPLAKGLFLNWRSTSSHVKLLPKEFFNYLCNTSRKYNENLLIFGEVFYGRIDYTKERKIVCTCPENVTGILINNMGYYGYNHSHIVNNLFVDCIPNYGRLHKIGQVIGYIPYYCSRKNINLTIEQEYNFKHKVEQSFNNCNASTLTFLHDGIDDNYVIEGKYDTTDNILKDKKLTK